MDNSDSVLVSVVIPSYDQQHVIFDALESVCQQETDFEYEILVVESTGDDTADRIRQKYPNIIVIELTHRAYPGTARNHAIKQARGRYIAFTDTDCIADRYWLSRLVSAHERGFSVVGGQVLNGTPHSLFGTLDYMLEFSEFINKKPHTRLEYFPTCNVSIEKESFEKYGLFPDQIKGSDHLFLRHIHSQGISLYYDPTVVIWHRNRQLYIKIARNQYQLGYGAAISRYKHTLCGSFLIRQPYLIPFLPFARLVRITKHLFSSNGRQGLLFLVLSPLALTVLVIYTIGFWRGRKDVLKGDK
jgi:glycosyltransferase involved in cell wall biosynthesis